jgi:hypothetical protein
VSDEGSDGALVAASGLPCHLEERIGHAGHRGDNHDGWLRTAALDDLDGVADSGRIG